MRLVLFACLAASLAEHGAHADPDADTLVDHPADARWWLSGQANAILQAQPGFHDPYDGDNSLRSDKHVALSLVGTVYAGFEITPTTAIVIAGESTGGGGLSDALGLGGFTNLDVVRNPALGATPYIARAFVDQIIPLSSAAPHDRDPLHVLRALPPRRIEIRAGKLSTAESFDLNSVGTDSHLQFMNWTVDNNGAWDYAADTRGYTHGAIVAYIEPLFAVRFGELLMPKVANGIAYDYDLAKARGENLELEIHDCLAGHPGIVRALGFLNHANMGSYAEANAVSRLDGSAPDITADRVPGRTKYGFGLNAEQDVHDGVRAFGRLGWADGKNEAFAYTEVDNTAELGFAMTVPRGKLGVAVVSNGLSHDHLTYLALGGKGFLLGDGKLRYGREDIAEIYYTARAYRGVFPAIDLQLVEHPGYNKDRGPVTVGSLRLHVEI